MGIFVQVQALGLAECPLQGVTLNLAGVIVKPALHLFFDDRFQFIRERNIHVFKINPIVTCIKHLINP